MAGGALASSVGSSLRIAGASSAAGFRPLERRLVHRRLERLVTIPVAVRFLDDDAAFEQQALEYFADVEFFVIGVAHAERDVLEVAEQRHVRYIGMIGH